MNATSIPLDVSRQNVQLHSQLQSYVSNHAYLIGAIIVLGVYVAATSPWKRQNAPASLIDPVPYVFNTFQFIFWNETFLNRVSCVRSTLFPSSTRSDSFTARPSNTPMSSGLISFKHQSISYPANNPFKPSSRVPTMSEAKICTWSMCSRIYTECQSKT